MAEYPALCGPDGFPLSWRHYQYGLAHAGRALLRRQREIAEAVKLANADKEGWASWTALIDGATKPR